ncbi:hypothetical protein SASPL_105072 [Salvia splendens]|uniref:Uncharacterized protein n=1 Tax=Salvia splendens TaxID=180675 RepID=A0A8X8YPT0_SALSN|nr:hypothetical protein SASPL_105072 [Salvia splendens]
MYCGNDVDLMVLNKVMDPGSSLSAFCDGFVPMNEDQCDFGFCNGLADNVPYYDAGIGADDDPDEGDGEGVDMDDNMNDEVQGVECSIDLMHAATAIIDDGKQQLLGDGVVMSAAQKKKMIESFYGCEVPSVIEVHPPQLVSTKGSGSRLISSYTNDEQTWSPLRKMR